MVEVICKLPVENVSFIMSPMTRRDPGVVEIQFQIDKTTVARGQAFNWHGLCLLYPENC